MLHDTQYITLTIMWFLHNAARISSCIKTGKNHTAVLIFCLCLYLYLYLYLNLNSYFYLYNIAMCIACDGEMMAPDGWSGRSVNSTFLPKLSRLIIPPHIINASMWQCEDNDNARRIANFYPNFYSRPHYQCFHVTKVAEWLIQIHDRPSSSTDISLRSDKIHDKYIGQSGHIKLAIFTCFSFKKKTGWAGWFLPRDFTQKWEN